MRDTLRQSLRSSLILLMVAVPSLAFALTIVPCSGSLGSQGCTAYKMTVLFMNIINFIVVISAMIAVMMFMYAGITMVTAQGNPAAIKHGKEMLVNVVIGIVLVLGAWTIIDTFMRIFVGETLLNRGKWFEIEPVPNPGLTKEAEKAPNYISNDPTAVDLRPGAGGENDSSPGNAGGGGQTGTSTGNPLLAAEARERLRQAGVQAQLPECAPGQTTNCINLGGVSDTRIAQIEQIAQQYYASQEYKDCVAAQGTSACAIQVSSGFRAGNGQSNHATGDAVDISGRTTAFNNWMNAQQGANTPTFVDRSGTQRYGTPYAGGTCTWHPNEDGSGRYHWHCSSTGR